ncbi:MFS transporter [Myceligenerans crystallogenes]|uniref:Major facilitator superfamily (MFS) profile domain-containing protein n=1 Tax=Myceligenerans crystallogenes TaxID=316335 RepID=A0ABN2N4C2_9MICO
MRRAIRSRSVRTFAATQFLLEVQFWFPIWLIYLLDLGFSLATAVLADAVFRIVSVACELPMGVLADRIGRKRAYLLMCGLTTVTFAAITFITSTPVLFAAWIVWGILWALTSGASAPYLYEICEREGTGIDPARAFGFVRATGNFAVVCSLLAAGYLYEADHRLPFAVTAGLGALALLLAFTLPGVPVHAGTRLSSVLGGIRGEIGVPAVRRAIWLGALLLLIGWSARILFQPLALDAGLSAQMTGWMYAAFAVATVLGSAVSGLVSHRHRRFAVVVAFASLPLTLLGTALAPELAPFGFLPVMGFGYALGTTAIEILTNEVTSRPVRGAIFGATAAFAGIGIAFARPGLGLIWEGHSAAYAAGWWALAGLVGLAVALPIALRDGPSARKRSSSTPDRPTH